MTIFSHTRKNVLFFATVAAVLASGDARAVLPGVLDPTFADQGRAILLPPGPSVEAAHAMVIQSDDKIVLAGRVHRLDSREVFLARYLPSGAPDSSFGMGGVTIVRVGSGYCAASVIRQLPSGQFLVAGTAVDSAGEMVSFLARFTSVGALDSSFGTGGFVLSDLLPGVEFLNDLEVLPDGRYLVCGNSEFSTSDFLVARFLASGTLDSSFGSQGITLVDIKGKNDQAWRLLPQSDGKVIVAGDCYGNFAAGSQDELRACAIRLTSTGALDTTFQTNGRLFLERGLWSCRDAISLSGGKFGMVGKTSGNSIYYAQLNSDGSMDGSVGASGSGVLYASLFGAYAAEGYGVAFNNGVIEVGGFIQTDVANNFDFVHASFKKVGADWTTTVTRTDFGGQNDEVWNLGLQSNGRVILSGLTFNDSAAVTDMDIAMARYTASGLDATFGDQGRVVQELNYDVANASYQAVVTQSDGGILAAGAVSVEGQKDVMVSRHLANGSLDLGFGDHGIVKTAISPTADDKAVAVCLAPDGKIVVAASAITQGPTGKRCFAAIRYLPDGSLDSDFNGTGIVTTELGDSAKPTGGAVVLADGRILVSGVVDQVGPPGIAVAVVCYTAQGELDTSFNGTGSLIIPLSSALSARIYVQPENKLLMAVSTGATSCTLISLVQDGTLDPAFGDAGQTTTTLCSGAGVAVQADGKIVVVGAAAGAKPSVAVVRLQADGALDDSFNETGSLVIPMGFGEDLAASDVTLEADGSIVVVGRGSGPSFGTGDAFAMLRLKTDGTLDHDFGSSGITRVHLNFTGTATDRAATDNLAAVAVTPSGKLIAGGSSDNDGREYAALIQVVSESTEPQLVLEVPPGTPVLPNSPTVDFGSLHAGDRVTKTFTIRNDGPSLLRLQTNAPAGEPSFSYDFTDTDLQLDPGESTTLRVSCSPKRNQILPATLRILSNDPRPLSGQFRADYEAMPTTIVGPPQSVLAKLGSRVRLTCEVDSTVVLERRWKRWRGVAATTLWINEPELILQPMSAGLVAGYSGYVADALGEYESDVAFVGAMSVLPPVTVLKPGTTLSLSVSAFAPAGTQLSYVWRRNGSPLEDDSSRISGSRSRNLRIKNVTSGDEDGYDCLVTMATPNGNPASSTGVTDLHVPPKPVLTADFSLPAVRVGETVDIAVPSENWPTRYTALGLPPGVTIDAATGHLKGRPTAAKLLKGEVVPYQVRLAASNPAGPSDALIVPWQIIPLPEKATGTFAGLVDRAELNQQLGGTVRMTITTAGAFSGSLKLGGSTLSFTGKLMTPPSGDPTGEFTIVRRLPLASITGAFTVNAAIGELIAATVTDGSTAPVRFSALRNPWSASNKATAYAYYHTAGLLNASPVAEEDLPRCPDAPGYVMLKVSSTGAVTLTGKLADGSALTGGSSISADGKVALQQILYGNTGSVQGWIQLSGTNVDGTADWFKAAQPAKSTTRSYKDGITLHDLSVVGGRYEKPGKDQLILGLPLEPVPDARVSFAGGGLDEELSQGVTVTKTHIVKVPSPSVPDGLKMSLNVTTGVLSGSFKQSDTAPARTAALSGVIVPRLGRGVGFFTLPAARVPPEPAAKTAIWSGSVNFGPNNE